MKEFGLKLKIDGDISDILRSLKNLKSAFEGVEMPDNLTKSLTKSIDSAVQKVGEFGKKSEKAINSLSDSKEIASAWKTVSKELTALQVKLEDIDAQKLFPKEVIDNLEKAEAAAKKYNSALVDAKNSDSYKNKLEELNKISELQRATESSSKKASQEALKTEAIYNKEKLQWTEEVNKQYQEQQQKITNANKALDDQQNKTKQLIELQKKLQSEGYLTTGKAVSKTKKEAVKQLANVESDEKGQRKNVSVAKSQVTRYKNAHAGEDLSKDQKYLALVQKQTEAEKELEVVLQRIKQLREQIGDTDKLQQAENIGEQIASAKALEAVLKDQATSAREAGKGLEEQKKNLDKAEKAYTDTTADAKAYEQNLQNLEQQQKDLNDELKAIQTGYAEQEWKDLIEVIKEFTNVDLSQSAQDIEQVNTAIAQYKEGQIKNLPEVLKQILGNTKPIGPAMKNVGEGIREAGESAEELSNAEKEIANLKNQVLQFFSITNAIQLFKRAITSALNTVKELDATMTEAAVVTEFDVSDMWDKLPRYSKEAQKLGVSINGMYQATTLYYQQGLKNNEAMQLGIETMKMGKIAAMDSTEATKAMTAALRGFNMELNETSATRVNDVYSQLAAVTAADTNQIATAMEKTASIAASANMEFETTAALLAQIIETTQEAPETAGTALKTIIARFSEVKSLKEQGQSTGTDSEGEVINVNKIQAALRSVGISMDGFFAGTEGLDSVLLKLSEKWSDLDFETQRYIATMAAGSRQQSRFIAMMSDYGRTTELVGEAQDSAGASQRQFEKTQESLATSLQKLQNAWKQFLMGLANNEVLKFAVDTLTFILEGINKIIDAISGGNGLIKSITSLMGVIGALKLGKSVFEGKGIGNILGGLTGKTSTKETITETEDKETGKIVRTIVKEPLKQGEQAGQEAGSGFVAGFKRAVQANKDGEKGVKSFLHNLYGKTNQRKLEKSFNDKGRKALLSTTDRKDFQKQLIERNKGAIEGQKIPASVLNQEVITVYKTEGVEAAVKKYEELGGSLLTVEERSQLAAKASKSFSVDLKAVGGTIQGVGILLGGVSAILSELGLEEQAEDFSKVSMAITALGTALSVLPGIIKGVQAALQALTVAGGPIVWIITIIGALVAVLIIAATALGAAIKKNSDTKQLEEIQSKLNEVGEAANRTKEELDNLSQGRENLKQLGNTLGQLTENTREWRQALLENNEQVLSLLDTYPELAQYVTKGVNGELTIKQEGFNKLEDKKLETYSAQIAAKTNLANQASNKQQEINTRLAIEKEVGLGWLHTLASGFGDKAESSVERLQTGGVTYEQLSQLAGAAADLGYSASNLTLTGENLKKAIAQANTNGANIDSSQLSEDFHTQLLTMGADFDQLANQVMAAKEAEKARMQATIESVAATSELVTNSEKFAEIVKQATLDNSEDYSDEITVEAEKKLELLNSDKNRDKAAQDQIYAEYAAMAGYGDAEQVRKKVEAGELSKSEIAYGLVTEDANDKLVKQMEILTKALESLDKRESKPTGLIKNLLSTSGSALSLKQLQQMGLVNEEGKRTEGAQITKTTLTDMGLTVADMAQLYKGLGMSSEEELLSYLNQQADLAYKSYQKSLENLDLRQIDLEKNIVAGLTAKSAQGISSNVERLASQQIDSNSINEMLSGIQNFLKESGLNEEEQQKMFDMIAGTNWQSAEELEQVATIWSGELGENSTAMIQLFDGIKELTGATENLTQAQLNEKGFTINSIIEKLAKGELNANALSTEDKDKIVGALGSSYANNFSQTSDGTWTYRGNLMGALTKEADESNNRAKHLQRQQSLYDDQVAYEKLMAKQKTETSTIVFSEEALKNAQNSMVADSNFLYADSEKLKARGATENRTKFNDLVGRYLRNEDVSEDELWQAYQAQAKENDGITGYDNIGSLLTQLDQDKMRVRASAVNLQEKGYTTTVKTDSEGTYETNLVELLDNEELYLQETRKGNQQVIARITALYRESVMSIGEKPQDDLTPEDMIAEIKRVREEFGSGKYTGVGKTDAQNQGAGVAASGGYASAYSYSVGEDHKDFQDDATKAYWNTVDAMHASLGAEAFTDDVENTTKGFAGLTGTLANASGEIMDTAKASKVLAVDMAQAYSKVTTLITGFSNYEDVLVSTNRELPEYAKALSAVKAGLVSVLGGTEEDITKLMEQGIITNDDIENMVAGSSTAFDKISKAIQESTLRGMAGAKGIVDETQLNAIMTITGEVDATSLQEQLKGMGHNIDIATEEGRKKIQELYNAAGKSIQFTVDTEGKTVSAVITDNITQNTFQNAWKGLNKGGSSSKYENSHDKQYNTYEKVNALLREREKLERRYDKLLKDRSATSKELIENSKQQLANLEEQRKKQEYLQSAKLGEINTLMSKNSKYSKYVNGFDEKTGTISINWDAINKIKSSSTGEKVDEYISQLEGLRDQWREAQDALDEIEDGVEEIKNKGKDEYLDLENRIKDALVGQRQEEIDKLSEINDSINDTNSRILESMQQQIDDYRQNRDNEKTEQELEDKQRRLAYLQQNTSGANAMEILNLQKEIEEGQESYTDQLIDQKISELQRQNDEAAEQRERQIELMQAQLEHDEEFGAFWPMVQEYLDKAMSGDITSLVSLLQETEGFKGMSQAQQEDFNTDLTSDINSAANYTAMQNMPEPQPQPQPEPSHPAWDTNYTKISEISKTLKKGSSGSGVKSLQRALQLLEYDVGSVDGSFGKKTKAAVEAFQSDHGLSVDGVVGPDTKKKFAEMYQYKTGGLADFTGPAWLDGTKSKPEYILNADQTKAFFALVDVLSGLQTKGSQTTQNSGDNSFDIDINVESIGNDYDVEQLANKIKSLINEDARYRNNNAINLMR